MTSDPTLPTEREPRTAVFGPLLVYFQVRPLGAICPAVESLLNHSLCEQNLIAQTLSEQMWTVNTTDLQATVATPSPTASGFWAPRTAVGSWPTYTPRRQVIGDDVW